MTYADLGPPIPTEARDMAPLRITHIEELGVLNGAGEAIVLVNALTWDQDRPIKLIIAANPSDGTIRRVAWCRQAGAGFIAADPDDMPGNLRDIVQTIVLDPRAAPA